MRGQRCSTVANAVTSTWDSISLRLHFRYANEATDIAQTIDLIVLLGVNHFIFAIGDIIWKNGIFPLTIFLELCHI